MLTGVYRQLFLGSAFSAHLPQYLCHPALLSTNRRHGSHLRHGGTDAMEEEGTRGSDGQDTECTTEV